LEVAFFSFRVARKGGLRLLVLQCIENLLIRDVTHLVVLLDQLSLLEANATLSTWDESVTCLVRLADVAVDATPSFAAFATVSASWCPIAISIGQRATQRRRAIIASKAWLAVAFAIPLYTFGELVALEVVEVAVEAGRAAIGAVFV
jgi:hypothetical protein